MHLQAEDEVSAMESSDKDREEDEYGVLLYYKYAEIPNLDELQAFYHSNCNSLALLGRVRLSPFGVNVTVETSLPFRFPFVSWEKHISEMGFHN